MRTPARPDRILQHPRTGCAARQRGQQEPERSRVLGAAVVAAGDENFRRAEPVQQRGKESGEFLAGRGGQVGESAVGQAEKKERLRRDL